MGLDEVLRTLKSRAGDWCWLESTFKFVFCLMKTLIFELLGVGRKLK